MNRMIYIVFALLLITACKHTKQLDKAANVEANSAKQLYKKMVEADLDFSYLQAKAKMSYDDGNMKQSFAGTFRLQKDEKIWISLTGPLGIEGGRVLIEKNRIQILDRLNNKYYDEDFSYLNKYTPFPMDFNMLQSIIVGNVIQHDISKEKIIAENPEVIVTDKFNGIDATYQINQYLKYALITLTQEEMKRNGSIKFEEYAYVGDKLFANLRTINFKDPRKQLNVMINFTKVSKESSLDFPFTVPDRLKK